MFFEVFSFAFRAGDAATALDAPMSVVLTASTAERYFGEANPIGQTLSVQSEDETFEFEVTGVIEDIPVNSHMDLDFVASWSSTDPG